MRGEPLTANTDPNAYVYDGNGTRVEKISGGATTVYVFADSKVVAEYVNGAAASAPTREYIYSGNQLTAKIEAGAVQYLHQDHLSVRLMTDSNGNTIGEQGHFPYGEAWYAKNTTSKWTFTTYERDSESVNDYAMAREYVSRLGRFSALDPAGLQSVDLTNPQTWNLYAYAQDNLLNVIDPLGLDAMDFYDCVGSGYDEAACASLYLGPNTTVVVNGNAPTDDGVQPYFPEAPDPCSIGPGCGISSGGGGGGLCGPIGCIPTTPLTTAAEL